MSNLDLIITEALEEITAKDELNEQLQEVLNVYNTDSGVGHKLKMIAWDHQ